jgi:AcrR family transcriptional regulator
MTSQPISPNTSPLPRGRHAAPPAVVRHSQRRRLLRAVAEAVAEKGYGAASVADVLARAGVSRRSFYELFENKQDCFLAAYDAGVDVVIAVTDAAMAEAAPDWRLGIQAATDAYLGILASRPAPTLAFQIEVLAAGKEALARREAVHERFAAQRRVLHRKMRKLDPALPSIPDYRFRAAVGASTDLINAHLIADRAETLPDLADAIVDVELAMVSGTHRVKRVGRGS